MFISDSFCQEFGAVLCKNYVPVLCGRFYGAIAARSGLKVIFSKNLGFVSKIFPLDTCVHTLRGASRSSADSSARHHSCPAVCTDRVAPAIVYVESCESLAFRNIVGRKVFNRSSFRFTVGPKLGPPINTPSASSAAHWGLTVLVSLLKTSLGSFVRWLAACLFAINMIASEWREMRTRTARFILLLAALVVASGTHSVGPNTQRRRGSMRVRGTCALSPFSCFRESI